MEICTQVDDVLRGFYVADDGRVNPVDATMALAKGARMYGARIFENTPVAGITQDNGRVTGVTTACGHHIEAEVVVNCAGMWARQFAEVAGVTVPNQATEHYYMLTGTMPDVQPDWPVVEDPASHAYIRPEGGGLMVGLFEPVAAAWNIKRIPSDFNFGEIEPDWERMTPFLDTAMARVPRVSEAGIKKFFCGPESFTPDLQPIVGEAPELRNYFVAAGLNSIGILTGGGIGRLMAHWITHGTPDMDVTGFNIDRLHKYQANPEYRAHRVIESLGRVYKCHYPSQTLKTARNAKLSPLHNRLQQKNPYFISVSGWESPSWYAPAGEVAAITEHTWGRENWFPYWQAEHQACREHVVLFDMSFMSKFLVQGRDAGKILNYLSTANVDANHGEMTYTQWLNGEGKLEADLTVAKLAESDAYLVVATDTMHRHVETWMRRAITRDHHAFITDVTGAYAMLSLQGPQARAVLQAATSADISHTAFPFRAFREIDVGYARVLCARMTYVGELGFELYVPAEQAVHVYDRLMAAGNIRSAGLRALGSLRMEKAYRDYGHDLDNTDTLLEAGLGFTCAFDKPDGFRGQAAVMKQKAGPGLTKRLVQVLCSDPEPLMFHAEVIRRNGKVVGNVRAASYGHTLGGAVGLGLVESDEPIIPAWLSKAEWTVEIGNQQFPAQISLRPFYDPTGQKIRQ